MVKELAPIVLSCAVWGRYLSGRCVLFECDISSVVPAVNKHHTREQNAMHLLRCLWFLLLILTLILNADTYVPGVNNHTVDHLPRNNLSAFFSLHPQTHHQATILPQPLLQMLEVGDRTGHHCDLNSGSCSTLLSEQFSPLHIEMLLCWTTALPKFLH